MADTSSITDIKQSAATETDTSATTVTSETIATWTPNYITNTAEYAEHDIISAVEFNAWINLLASQHNDLVKWLYGLTQGDFAAVYPSFTESLDKYTNETILPKVEAKATEVVGFYTDHKDDDGNETDDLYMHW